MVQYGVVCAVTLNENPMFTMATNISNFTK